VQIQCAEAVVTVRVVEPATGRFSGRELNPDGEMASDFSRFIALSIVEIMASRAAGEAAVGGGTSDVPSVVSPEASVSEPSPNTLLETARNSRGPRIGAMFLLHGGNRPFSLSIGARLGLALALLDHLSFAIDFSFYTGTSTTGIGEIRGGAYSGALFALARLPIPFGEVNVGGGYRLGTVIYRGTPDDATAADGFKTTHLIGGPCVAVKMAVNMGRLLVLPVAAELGYLLQRAAAEVDSAVETASEGVWLLFGVGIGVRP
jgi:hypothetical protein